MLGRLLDPLVPGPVKHGSSPECKHDMLVPSQVPISPAAPMTPGVPAPGWACGRCPTARTPCRAAPTRAAGGWWVVTAKGMEAHEAYAAATARVCSPCVECNASMQCSQRRHVRPSPAYVPRKPITGVRRYGRPQRKAALDLMDRREAAAAGRDLQRLAEARAETAGRLGAWVPHAPQPGEEQQQGSSRRRGKQKAKAKTPKPYDTLHSIVEGAESTAGQCLAVAARLARGYVEWMVIPLRAQSF